jgi:two-component system sensor histidine kinase KdpD
MAQGTRKDLLVSEPARRSPNLLLSVAVGGAAVGLIVLALVPFRDDITAATPALLLTAPGLVAGILGSRRTAVIVALAAALAFNLFFLEPYGTFKVDVADDVLALVVFAAVATGSGVIAAREAELRRAAELRAREMEALYHRVEAVQADRERLTDEVSRLALIEEVDAQRAALLRSVSHDLRTPLATIRAVSSDLLDGTGYDDATRDELIALVADEADRLDRLVANLLNLSRIEGGALRPERQAVALDELVSESVRRLGRLFRDVRVDVNIRADLPFVDADYTQIDQVVSNLLENASRHAPSGSTVRISARPVGDEVEVTVADEGHGINAFERERIFEPFQRGNTSVGRGSGIGLAICKAVVTAHGGKISVQSPSGVGARFVFTLPVRRA